MLSNAPLDLMYWSLLKILSYFGPGLRRVVMLLKRKEIGL